jgi:D-glycero-D-manno-heptose 1,7-bisphosphate phosphatase
VPTPALFLDRDGIINEETHYLYRIEDVRWVPGIFQLCRRATELGYKLVVVTNQAGIGRGIYTQADFDTLTTWIHNEFASRKIPLAATYHCPYHPQGIGEYQREHEDRKPSPGMLLRAARDLDLDLSQSLLVGDRCTDIAAANAANLRQAFLLSGTEPTPCPGSFHLIYSLSEVIPHLAPRNS